MLVITFCGVLQGHACWLHSSRLCCSWAQLELTTNPSAYSHAAVGIRVHFMPPKAWEVQKLSLCEWDGGHMYLTRVIVYMRPSHSVPVNK